MRYCSKQFLSTSPHESGSIITSIETPLVKDLYNYGGNVGIKPSLEAGVTFRACHGEPVNLDFNASSQKSFDKRLEKITLMIDELTKMRGQMTEMWYSHLRDIEFKTNEDKKK